MAVLREHRERQLNEKEKWGTAWQDTGKVFTQENGSWLHPETASETFRRILASTDPPPITLRDLRHVTTTLTHGGGGDLHTIKETLLATPRSRSPRTRTRACCPRATKLRQKPPPRWSPVPVRPPQ
ncbi:hypothetical protein [Streptomyces sp. AK02-01A]|uniref:hypothetical protein n=1 Tax=Streptomyces sp. AK02-01A TaxID=3028648 RepID=UPI0039F6CA74